MYLPVSMLHCCHEGGFLHHVYVDVELRYAFASDGRMCLRVPIEPESTDVSGYVSQEAIQFAGTHGGSLTRDAEYTWIGEARFPNPRPRMPGQTDLIPYPVAAIMAVFTAARPGIMHLDVKLLLHVARAVQRDDAWDSTQITLGYLDATREAIYVRPYGQEAARCAEAMLMPLKPPAQPTD